MSDRRIASSAAVAEIEETSAGITTLAKLVQGRQHTKPSIIPGTRIAFVWRVLGGREKQECLAGALQRFKDMGMPPELRHYTDLEDEVTWQMIGRAMRDPEIKSDDRGPYPKPLATIDEIRDTLSTDERDIMMSEYMDLEDEVDPDPMFKSEQWHAQVEEALKKSQVDEAAKALSLCGLRMLAGYLLTTVRPQLISQTGKSTSSPPDTKTQPEL